MPIHLPSNQSVGEGELRRKRLGKEIGLEPRMEHTMRQVDTRFRVGAWGQRGAERWTRLIRYPNGTRKFVPQLRCSMFWSTDWLSREIQYLSRHADCKDADAAWMNYRRHHSRFFQQLFVLCWSCTLLQRFDSHRNFHIFTFWNPHTLHTIHTRSELRQIATLEIALNIIFK